MRYSCHSNVSVTPRRFISAWMIVQSGTTPAVPLAVAPGRVERVSPVTDEREVLVYTQQGTNLYAFNQPHRFVDLLPLPSGRTRAAIRSGPISSPASSRA